MKETVGMEGILLRMERLKQGKEQKEICTGICSVSTLSKIETGKQKADPVMLAKLYRELGICYLDDKETCCRLEKKVKQFFYELQYQKEYRAWKELKKEEKILENSPLAVDWMVIRALVERAEDTGLEECREYLTRRQLGWYLLAHSSKLGEHAREEGEEAVRILQNSFSQISLIHILYMSGAYREVLEWADKAAVQALEEGNLWTLAESYNMKGTVYACFNMEELMLKEYKRAAHLLEESRWKRQLKNIYYNIGATYLGTGRFEEAERYLKLAEGKNPFMVYHKFALLYSRMGRKEEAKEAYERMQKCRQEQDAQLSDLEPQILELTRMELEGQMDREEFVVGLETLMETFHRRKMFGYMMFFHDLLQNQYKKRRQYRKAFLLEQQFSDLQRKSSL